MRDGTPFDSPPGDKRLIRLHLREAGAIHARGAFATRRWLWAAAIVAVCWYVFVVVPAEAVRQDQTTLQQAVRSLELVSSTLTTMSGGAEVEEAGAQRFVVEVRGALPSVVRAAGDQASTLRSRTRDLENALRLGTFTTTLYRDALDEFVQLQSVLAHRMAFTLDRSRSLSNRMALLTGLSLLVLVGAAALTKRNVNPSAFGAIGGEHLGQLLFEHSPESVSVADASERIVAVNPAYERVTGYLPAEVRGLKLGFDASGEQDESFFHTMRAELARTGRWAGEIWQRRKNGEAYAEKVVRLRVDDTRSRALGYLTVSMDPTPNRDAQRLLNWQAHHDALTKLPNRTLLLERLARVLVRVRHTGEPGAILSIDIDGFKRVNDSVGPLLGDRLLTEASTRIVISVSESDTVARLGSDKFAVMLPDLGEQSDPDRTARRILEAFRLPFVLEGCCEFVTASIGVALFPEDGTDSLRLLQRADAAMAQAKTHDGNAVVFYEPQMNARAERRHAVETDLRRALREGELTLHYQPVIDRVEQRIVGAEALVRWQHPEWGLVSPGEFISVAEESGLIVEMGQWVLDAVRAQVVDWQGSVVGGLRVAVNLSARELKRAEDLETLKRLIARVPEGRLGIEITESVLLSETHEVISFLSALRDIGVRVALDDFGTGYSSLSNLRRFQFDVLKIDRSFVKDLDRSAADRALVTSIVSLGKILSLDVVAEGVETEAQLQCLAQAGCRFVQGYYFAKPMPADVFAAFVAESSFSV